MSSPSREKQGRFAPEVRARAVRLVQEQTPQHSSQWAAITAIAPKLGCTKEALRRWVRELEREGRGALWADTRGGGPVQGARARESRAPDIEGITLA